jgi:hypothetical protein
VTDDPTYEGYRDFLQEIVGIPPGQFVDPAQDKVVRFSYDMSLNFTYYWLMLVPSQPTSPSVYATAVYCLGADNLINFAPDIPTADPPTFWSDLRKLFGVGTFAYGWINFSSDQSTSQGMAISDALKNMTLGDLQNMKTPWGRQYLAIAQNVGTLWGMS